MQSSNSNFVVVEFEQKHKHLQNLGIVEVQKKSQAPFFIAIIESHLKNHKHLYNLGIAKTKKNHKHLF
jgi:hypothetical protein